MKKLYYYLWGSALLLSACGGDDSNVPGGEEPDVPVLSQKL